MQVLKYFGAINGQIVSLTEVCFVKQNFELFKHTHNQKIIKLALKLLYDGGLHLIFMLLSMTVLRSFKIYPRQ